MTVKGSYIYQKAYSTEVIHPVIKCCKQNNNHGNNITTASRYMIGAHLNMDVTKEKQSLMAIR